MSPKGFSCIVTIEVVEILTTAGRATWATSSSAMLSLLSRLFDSSEASSPGRRRAISVEPDRTGDEENGSKITFSAILYDPSKYLISSSSWIIRYSQNFFNKFSDYSLFSISYFKKTLTPPVPWAGPALSASSQGRARLTFGISSRSVQPAALTLRTRSLGLVVRQGVTRTLFCAGEEGLSGDAATISYYSSPLCLFMSIQRFHGHDRAGQRYMRTMVSSMLLSRKRSEPSTCCERNSSFTASQ